MPPLKQEAIYLEEIQDGFQARKVIRNWMAFYWSASTEWFSLYVSAWSDFGLSERCFRALVGAMRSVRSKPF